MSQSIEWAYAAWAPALYGPDEETEDGNTPGEGHVAIITEGIAVYGTPAEVRTWLSRAIEKLDAEYPAEVPR